MPSHSSTSLANLSRKNLPNIVSDLSLLDPKPILNGLFKFAHKDQAVNLPLSHKYHQIQTITTVQPTAFTTSNTFFDFNLPMNIDMLDEEILLVTLANSDPVVPWVADAPLPFWFQRLEIRHDNEIKETIRDIQLYMENTIYQDDFERTKAQPLNTIDASTYKVNAATATVPLSGSATFRLKLNTLLAKCNIFLKGLKGQVVFRFYPQTIGVFSSSVVNSSITLQSTILLLREIELTQDARNKMIQTYRSNVDFRYLDVITEQTVLNLSANTTTKYVTNNFHDSVYSHVIVLSRLAPSLSGLVTFNSHNNVYLEDVSSMNLSNGIQWTDADLRLVVYQSHFPNAMTQQADMNIYVPLAASCDPVKANKDGIQNGYDVLPRNAKVCINPAITASNTVDILAYVYSHCRVEGGKINIF